MINLPIWMIICLICTILIEIVIAYILRVKDKKDFVNIILANCITNPLLVAISTYINVYYGLFARRISMIILEILAIIIEGYIYKKNLNFKKIKPYILSFILNFSSYFLGILINHIIY